MTICTPFSREPSSPPRRCIAPLILLLLLFFTACDDREPPSVDEEALRSEIDEASRSIKKDRQGHFEASEESVDSARRHVDEILSESAEIDESVFDLD